MNDTILKLPDGVMRLSGIFCGCSDESLTWLPIMQELERCESGTFDKNAGLAAAICHHCDLTEHGVSIRGGWLTNAGKAALAFLREYGVEWQSGKGIFVDSTGCHHGQDAEDA